MSAISINPLRWLVSIVLMFALLPGWEISGNIQRQSSTPTIPQSLSETHVQSTTTTKLEWDDADSHKWIGESSWGDGISVDWVEFSGRKVLRARVTPSGKNWALMRTDAFPAENWENKYALRADIFQAGGSIGIDVKLEVRGPQFDSPDLIQSIMCNNLARDSWTTCTWIFDTAGKNYNNVSYLSIVFDHLNNSSPVFYVENIRLVSGGVEDIWDDMDDGSRNWYYWGNWCDWTPKPRLFGLEPITHNGQNPTTPPGSIFLQWDYERGKYPPGTTVEVKTENVKDISNWITYNRISADVKVSDPDVPISVFFWDDHANTGFGTPAIKTGIANTWKTLIWDVPWPYWFNTASVDDLHLVVNNIDVHKTGVVYFDNITLISDDIIAPTNIEYVFEDFNEDFEDRIKGFNDFSGNWGVLNRNYIITETIMTDPHVGTWGASQRLYYHDLFDGAYTGVWYSLWGHSDYTQTQTLDLTDFYKNLDEPAKDLEQIRFWVRGSGKTFGRHNVKVELKDASKDYNHTAYRYISIDDISTQWREVVLDADVTNASFWSYNSQPPDPTKMKELVFVIESAFNNSSGTFYIDDIRFVDLDDEPFDLLRHTDDKFLDLVSQRTFLYFLDWYDPNTCLFQDRSTFPDLMSTAATGFGLTALTIGESRGWINRPQAITMTTCTLQNLFNGHSSVITATGVITGTNGYKGFYYHFLGKDGFRKIDENPFKGSELSSIDTAILMAGVLTAREYFSDVPDIVSLADKLYQRVEWDWMLNSSNDLFYMAWKPECEPYFEIPAPGGGCFSSKEDGSPLYWDYYTDEIILINLLAIGSPAHPVPIDTFYAWPREEETYAGYTLVQSWPGSYFTYVFAHLWADFRNLGVDHPPLTGTQSVDWWQNSVAATQANRQFAIDHKDDVACDGDDHYTTYGENSWGLTAAEGPDGNYYAYGALPAASYFYSNTISHDGTIAPYGAGMAAMFLPQEATAALKHYFANTDLWRYRFGFGDAYNLDPPDCSGFWYNHATFGIDQGPMLISIENQRSSLIWETLKRNNDLCKAVPAIWNSMCVSISKPKTAFTGLPVALSAAIKPVDVAIPVNYTWQASDQITITHSNALTDTVSFTWNSLGEKEITLTVENGSLSGKNIFKVTVYPRIFLPIIRR